jgi:hypothetical protein
MILPTKTLPPSRCLLGVGANVLRLLGEPMPISRLWPEFKAQYLPDADAPTVSFAWFILSLDLLFALGAIELDHGRIVRSTRDSPNLQ